ncbi:MAG TPA: AraC family transcriptional regulator [Burkholderiaceae bacterium]|nr:AraC family transcriptional regulator [Burkholderiaceae bacterium]
MIDPLAEIVVLLAPGAPVFKIVGAAGRWQVRRAEYGRPFFCVVLDGRCRLAVDGHEPVSLHEGDFVLIPSASAFTMSGPGAPQSTPPANVQPLMLHGEIRHGRQSGPPDVRLLVGYCSFQSPDATLLVSLLPRLVHVRGGRRLATLVDLVRDETREVRPARDVVLGRLLQVLFIEALRSTGRPDASPGLLRGLSDPRLAAVIRKIHQNPDRPWTVALLAKEAALSRSAFFDRFSRAIGMAPIEYLLAWRMALAKNLIRRKEVTLAEIAERVGYSSTSAFSVAFSRHVGMPPSQYARRSEDSPV